PSWRNAVVLFEDIGERPYRIDRSLTQLLQAGAFVGVRGVAVGQLTSCREPDDSSYTALDIISERLAELGVPMVGALPLGHEASSRAVLVGGEAEIDGAQLRVT